MSTKLNPGPFDCYAAALPDEPIFVLLARDMFAPTLIGQWADMRATLKEGQRDGPKEHAARLLAANMEHWRKLPANALRVAASKRAMRITDEERAALGILLDIYRKTVANPTALATLENSLARLLTP